MKFNAIKVVMLAVLALGVSLVVSSMAYVGAAGEIKLYSAPSSVSVTTGGQFDVAVRLSKTAPERVDYVSSDIAFPASRLEVVSINSSGTVFSSGSNFSYDNRAGVINVSGESTALATPSDSYIATIRFRAKSAGGADIVFAANSVAGDLFGPGKVKNYLTSMSGTSVTVSSPPAPAQATKPSSPTPAPATTPAPTEPTPTEAPAEIPVTTDTPAADDGPEGLPQSSASETGEPVAGQTADLGALAKQHWWVGAVVLGILAVAGAALRLYLARTSKDDAVVDIEPAAQEEFSPAPPEPSLSDEQFISSVLGGEPVEPEGSKEVTYVDESLMAEVEPEPQPVEEVVEAPAPVREEPARYAPTSEWVEPVAVTAHDIAPTPILETQVQAPTLPKEIVLTPQPLPVPPQASATPRFNVAAQSVQTPTSPAVTPQAGDDDIPDMFELGAERLRQEGYVSNVTPFQAPPQQ